VGAEPVFATLVSTGQGGAGDPTTTHATVQGEFLIHTKHVTETLSSDQEGDVFDHRDVPYVQFFKDGYALHAAHWHDAFGKPRSHGCINLAPSDARWLFEWTDPEVPDAWHGAMSLLDGTLISIHP
jgi:lipoprotein-anchoring transpeptidase ErfK/SrfK